MTREQCSREGPQGPGGQQVEEKSAAYPQREHTLSNTGLHWQEHGQENLLLPSTQHS